jgi:hypothetical protein
VASTATLAIRARVPLDILRDTIQSLATLSEDDLAPLEVEAVYQRDLHGRAPQPARRLETAEVAADDDNAVGAHDATPATGWAVAISLSTALSDLRSVGGLPAPEPVPYDPPIVAGGSQYSYFRHDDWSAHPAEVESLASALTVRSPSCSSRRSTGCSAPSRGRCRRRPSARCAGWA